MRRPPQQRRTAAAAAPSPRGCSFWRLAAALLAASSASFWVGLHWRGQTLPLQGSEVRDASAAALRLAAPPPHGGLQRAAGYDVPAEWGGVILAPPVEEAPQEAPPLAAQPQQLPGDSGAALLASLPRGASVFVTFATGHMAPFAFNWAAHARALGLRPLLIGALDDEMATLAADNGVPCVRLDGSAVLAASAGARYFNTGNPAFRRMGGVKTAFVWELLSQGLHPVLSDADVVWLRDPRPYFAVGALGGADILVSTDCLDVAADEASDGAGSCDRTVNFNTGVLHLRATPGALEFVSRWHDKVTTADESWMRDQPAFNLLMRGKAGLNLSVVNPERPKGDRALLSGADGLIKLGVLSPALFANGHTYFVQQVHRHGREPYSVHLTYQYGDHASFAFGKRQRLRQAGLWAMEDAEYYAGKFVVLADEGASFPPADVGSGPEDWREALRRHFAEDLLRRRSVRSLLAVARALGRIPVLPRALCYCDKMWNNLHACRAPGGEAMALPFECPMDHIFNVPHWVLQNVSFREAGFLDHSHLRQSASWARVLVREPGMPPPAFAKAAASGGSLLAQQAGSWDAPDATIDAGVSDEALAKQLARFADVTVLELSAADTLLCGLSATLAPPKPHGAATPAAFNALARRLLDYTMWFCLTEPWAEAGKPGFVPGVTWERDVVVRHCGADEGALRRSGRLRPGVVLDEPLCACEWAYAQPPDLPVLQGAECEPAQRDAAARLLADDT